MLVFLSPGQSYRLQLKVRSLAVDASGIMKTGKVEFAVDDPVSQREIATFDNETGVSKIKGSKRNVERIINGWPVPNTISRLPFPKELRGNWRIQDATVLTSKRPEYIDQVAVIDDNSLHLTSGEHSNRYRLSYWRHRDDNQSIELDLVAESPAGTESRTFQCL